MANAKRTRRGAFAQQGFTALDDVLLDKHLAAPLSNAGVDLQSFVASGWADEAGVHLQQRRTDDAGGFV